MLNQRRKRWADVVQMLYKWFVFAGNSSWSGIAYCWWRLQADTDPMSVNYIPACWQYKHDALNQSWVNVGPPSVTLAHIQLGAKHDTVTQNWANVASES